jgi:hypothetical protein
MQVCPQMTAIITAIAAKHSINLEQVGAHLRLDMPGYDRLCIERISPRCISVAHYFEMNSDLVAEPDIVFFVDSIGIWFPIFISQSLTGWREYAELNDAGTAITRYQPQAQKDLAGFAEMWAENIRHQAWLEEGVLYMDVVGG